VADRLRWHEPTSLLALTWGTYLDRYVIGLVLIIGGSIHLLGANTWTLPILVTGAVAALVGWAILPSKGSRRIVAVGPGMIASLALLTGPLSIWVLALSFVSWMLVRHRPARSYLVVVFPIATGVILPQYFSDFSGMLPALGIGGAVLVASAWIARMIAASAPVPMPSEESIR
jgi:hypothetical protein